LENSGVDVKHRSKQNSKTDFREIGRGKWVSLEWFRIRLRKIINY
jgi:hypothetical protein